MTSPGMMLLPVRSTVTAPAGGWVLSVLPTDAIRPSRTTTVCRSRAGAPVPSITRTLVSAKSGSSNEM